MSESNSGNAYRFVSRRRALLAAVGAAPVTAAVLLTQRQRAVFPALSPDAGQRTAGSVGYHETEHIRKYYRSVEF